MTQDILSGLTPPQQQATQHIDGPMLVLAGPGSGKTRVITHRIAHLIQSGVKPWEILAITFTNKAAAEMRERLTAMGIPRGTTACTFHALAVRILREFCEQSHLPKQFTIYDTADQKAAVRDALKLLEMDPQKFPPQKVLARISNLKNDLVTPHAFSEQQEGDYLGRLLAKVYQGYQKQLDTNGAVDFDDLLMKFAFLLKDVPEVRETLNQRYKYVLVDEYQDTNQCQYQIARGLSMAHNNLFVTGDPDQSIYAWRGADISNILAFEEDYPNAVVVKLEENFRSVPEILTIASELIAYNSKRKNKALFTSLNTGTKPNLIEHGSEYNEADHVATWAKQCHDDGYSYSDIAIFYRVNALSRVLEESLRRKVVPYQIIRGVEFFQRKEIKDMLAYLKYLVNPEDQVSFKRIINTPARGIGNTSVERLTSFSVLNNMSIEHVIANVEMVTALGPAAQTKVKKFVEMINKFKTILDQPVAKIIELIYIETGLRKSHHNPILDNEGEQVANINELIKSAAEYDAENAEASLENYLHEIALVADTDNFDATSGAISLMTMHAAKGLEFPCVLIIGLEEGLIPHARSQYSDDELEEERRLLFVGITRAKERLTLSYARNRTLHGSSNATVRSQFIRELTSLDVPKKEPATFVQKSKHADAFPNMINIESTLPKKETVDFTKGEIVRHAMLGLGRIEKVIPARENAKVIVKFNTGATKTLIVKYAKLQKIST